MHVTRDPFRASDLPRGGIVTIGNFDGVHLGHRKILEAVVARARAVSRPAVAITFEPHPMAILKPDLAPRRIQTLRQKEEVLEALGIDLLLVIPFTRDFSLTEPEEFVRDLLCTRLGASELYIGHHFAFGRGKRGDLALLRRMGPECGFSAAGVDEVSYKEEPISSTRIRHAVGRGANTSSTASFPGGIALGARSDTLPSTSLRRTSSIRLTASMSPRSRFGPSGAASTA